MSRGLGDEADDGHHGQPAVVQLLALRLAELVPIVVLDPADSGSIGSPQKYAKVR